MYYLGIDIGSSSIKVALVEASTGIKRGLVQEPEEEMSILALENGWAEQEPEVWWQYVCKAIKKIKKQHAVLEEAILGIGIAYQMHGLVLLDKKGTVLRNAIIWCDSRAVSIGNTAYDSIGKAFCDANLLNSPANFTASKLKWVKENEPELYAQVHKFMLPGDYIAYKLSNNINTTISGLSEGIFWDFKKDKISDEVLNQYQISKELVPNVVSTFGQQGNVSEEGANESGLKAGIPILYRSGDQPNNALTLNVFKPGEIAATGGTSGVVYAITDDLSVKETSRVNNFAHVNYQKDNLKRIGKLLCINGAGIQYRWLLNNLDLTSYEEMNTLANTVTIGADGVCVISFGNGAERMLNNQEIGSRFVNLNLNRHTNAHICRATLEGIAFSFVYGIEIMKTDGVVPKVIKAGNDNLFRASIFSNTIATLVDCEIEIFDTSGAVGAARACVISDKGYELFSSFTKHDYVTSFLPSENKEAYQKAYQNWKKELELIINK